MSELKFTQEIKDKWLAALKSGKYVQGTGDLVINQEGKVKHCCIGVLGCEIDGLDNDVDCQNKNSPYEFLRSTIGREAVVDLWRENDSLGEDETPDYSNVIPLIEQLPVQD